MKICLSFHIASWEHRWGQASMMKRLSELTLQSTWYSSGCRLISSLSLFQLESIFLVVSLPGGRWKLQLITIRPVKFSDLRIQRLGTQTGALRLCRGIQVFTVTKGIEPTVPLCKRLNIQWRCWEKTLILWKDLRLTCSAIRISNCVAKKD